MHPMTKLYKYNCCAPTILLDSKNVPKVWSENQSQSSVRSKSKNGPILDQKIRIFKVRSKPDRPFVHLYCFI